MVTKKDNAAILISIYPKYANAILAGSKQVEFRKVRFKKSISHLVLYSTSPVKAIVGFAEVEDIVAGSPGDLWHEYAHAGHIHKLDFDRYFSGKKTGWAIKVRNAKKIPSGLGLKELGLKITPPQSFCYLDKEKLNRIIQLHKTTRYLRRKRNAK